MCLGGGGGLEGGVGMRELADGVDHPPEVDDEVVERMWTKLDMARG